MSNKRLGYVHMTHHTFHDEQPPPYIDEEYIETRTRCERSGKKIFTTRTQAGAWLIENNLVNRFRVYECEFCSQLHLATREEIKLDERERRIRNGGKPVPRTRKRHSAKARG